MLGIMMKFTNLFLNVNKNFLKQKSITMNIKAEKANIIEQFKQVNDEKLISAIKSLPDYASAKEKEIYDIPDDHQKLVMERFKEIRKNPERLLDWEEAKKSLRTK
jgi:hypothetical protein